MISTFALLYLALFFYLLICLGALFRNDWVYKQRTMLIDNNLKYSKLWNYDKMFRHFWIWNIEKMKYTEKSNDA